MTLTHQLTPTLHGPASGRQLQSFSLTTADGNIIRSQSFRQRNNVILVFHHGPDCSICQTLLSSLSDQQTTFADQNAKIIAIGPPVTDNSLTMAIDPSGKIASQHDFTIPAVAIVDRFGELWAVWNGGTNHRLPHSSDVLEWLEFLEVQCPECEPPEPWGDEI